MLKALAIGLCAVVLVSCGGDEQSAPKDAGVDGSTAGTVVLDCADAALGEADPAWRARSTVAGDFGLYGRGRNFGSAQRRRGGDLSTKIPAIVAGEAAVTLSVPPHERGSVGLYPPNQATKVEQAYTEVTFEPCTNRTATGWPFGLILVDRDPVELRVRRDGAEEADDQRRARLDIHHGRPSHGRRTAYSDPCGRNRRRIPSAASSLSVPTGENGSLCRAVYRDREAGQNYEVVVVRDAATSKRIGGPNR